MMLHEINSYHLLMINLMMVRSTMWCNKIWGGEIHGAPWSLAGKYSSNRADV
jgi:hypothetical protein